MSGTTLQPTNNKIFRAALSGCLIILTIAGVTLADRSAEENIRSCKALRAMARVYMAYGKYAKAQPLVEQALALARAENDGDPEFGSCLIDLSFLYKLQGRLADAEEMCQKGLKIQQKIYFENHPYIAVTLQILSSIYEQQGDYQKAISTLNRAIAIMQESCQPKDPLLAPFYVAAGDLQTEQGNFTQAEDYYQRAMVLMDENRGPHSLYRAVTLGKIAWLYTLQKRYDEAEKIITETVLPTQEKVYGKEHPLLLPTWLTIAKVRQSQQQYSQAEALLRKALAATEKQYGSEHPLTGKVLGTLGEVYIAQDNFTAAESICQRAAQVLENSLGPHNDYTAMAINNLARIYIHQKKYARAEGLCQKAIKILNERSDCAPSKLEAVHETIALLEQKSKTEIKTTTIGKQADKNDNLRDVVNMTFLKNN